VDPYLLLKSLHGMLAILGVVGLAHPCLLLRPGHRPPPAHRRMIALSSLAVVGTLGLGSWIYPAYRLDVKPGRLDGAPLGASLFESKEHLAFFVGALVLGGAVMAWQGLAEGRRCLRLGLLLMVVTWGLGLGVGAIPRTY
jgi:hypothetical protein